MATITAFDNINKLNGARRRSTYTEYFDKMEITPEQKRKRVALADEIEDIVLLLFEIYIVALRYGGIVDRKTVEETYREMLSDAISEAGIRDGIMQQYLDEIAAEEARVTAKRYRDDAYWTSYDRAITIAEDDANILWDNEEYAEAVDSGATKKQWVTMKDERVRPTHVAVDDDVVDIDDYFVVGNSLMRFPGDMNCSDMSEVINCRCSCLYF